MIEWLRYFPYPEAREVQVEALDALVRGLDSHDVIVMVAPTALGKTAISRTLMNAFHSVSVITPTNQLVDQFLSEFPETPTLARLDSYRCEEWKRPCSVTRAKLAGFCRVSKDAQGNPTAGCPCSKDLSRAKYKEGPGVYNYHTYLAHKIYRKVLVVDECMPGYTRVKVGESETLTIGDIFRRWEKGKRIQVLSFNEVTKEFETKLVTHAWKRPGQDKRMIRIVTSGPTLECTDNHLVLTDRGYFPAGQIDNTHRIIGNSNGRSGLLVPYGDTLDMLVGSALGDGYWRSDKQCNGGSRLSIRNGHKQRIYAEFKSQVMGLPCAERCKSGYTGSPVYGCDSKYIEDTGITNTYELIDKLNEKSLAIWFCDDGSIVRKGGRLLGARLHTEAYNTAEVEYMIAKLGTMGISGTRRAYKQGRYNYIHINKKNADKLLDLIAPYVPISMQYKTHSHPRTGEYTWGCNEYRDYRHFVVKSVEEIHSVDYVYDIEVQDNHNFLVSAIQNTKSFSVVHNCHQLIPTIKDRLALTIWQHDYPYPSNMYTTEQMLRFIDSLPENKRKHKKIQIWKDALTSKAPDYVAERSIQPFNGKGTARGFPEDRECIRLLPVDISGAPPMFWPGLGRSSSGPSQPGLGRPGKSAGKCNIEKVVLLSATIGRKDVEALGLGGRRVLYINCKSPISASRRPIIVHPLVSVNRYNLESAASQIARYIDDVLAPRYAGQKGVVHATYQMASLLWQHLGGNLRYMFHTRDNKKEIYERFRAMPPDSGAILVASGMYEGIDLPEDLGRWQVVSKIPWPSLGSQAVRHQLETDPEAYNWEVLKTVIQACGRICRTPTDRGETWVLDSTFDRLYTESSHLMPAWYLEALHNSDTWESRDGSEVHVPGTRGS